MNDDNDLEVARRIKQLRLYHRMTGLQMADRLGISYPRYKNYEYGFSLPAKIGLQVCRQFPGVTLEWLYRGRTTAMDKKFAMELQRVQVEMARAIG